MERTYALFSKVLLYPEFETRDALAELRNSLDMCPQAAESLDHFAHAIAGITFEAWEELYTRTFDVTAQCPLYVGIHLFGADNPKRPMLMAGLCDTYARASVNAAVELPDHLAVIVANRTAFDEAAWEDLTSLCLIPAIATMITVLECASNPYRYVLAALEHTLRVQQGVAAHV